MDYTEGGNFAYTNVRCSRKTKHGKLCDVKYRAVVKDPPSDEVCSIPCSLCCNGETRCRQSLWRCWWR